MAKKSDSEKRCGNCKYHSTYNYPELIFCDIYFLRNENAVYPTLAYCEFWEPAQQKCYCIEEALRQQKKS